MKVEVITVTMMHSKPDKVLENKQASSLKEIIRRMKAAQTIKNLDPIINHKLAQVYKN